MTDHVFTDTPRVLTRQRVRGGHSLRKAFVLSVMLLFLALRVATSSQPVYVDAAAHVGAQTTAQQNLPLTAGCAVLLVALVVADPAIAFAFILCDMNGFGAFFDLDQWGIAGLFKFRDLEMGILLAWGAVFWLAHSSRVRKRRTSLGNYLARLPWIITAIALVYTALTLRVQDLATTLRYSRQLYVWLLLLTGAQFIRTRRDLERVVSVMAAYVALAAALYVAQALSPPQTILRYSQQMNNGDQTRVWSNAMLPIFLGGMAIFAYQLQARRSRKVLWIVFALCAVAIVMSQGRMLTATFVAAIGTMILHRAVVTGRVGLAVRIATTTVAVLVACTVILWATNRLDPLLKVWNSRIGELDQDVRVHQGSWSSRLAMFEYLPTIIERNGGGLLASCFGMGLRALTPAELAPMVFWGVISPPIWADNGLAGVTFTFGYCGLLLLLIFVVTLVWRLRVHAAIFRGPLCRSLTFAAAFYFATVLPYMFFSASFLGGWDDALAVVVLLILVDRASIR